jgi:hypothetical protein
MQCAVRRWGPGTTKERPTSTQVAKELQERLVVLQSERQKQDAMWNPPQTQEGKKDPILVGNGNINNKTKCQLEY